MSSSHVSVIVPFEYATFSALGCFSTPEERAGTDSFFVDVQFDTSVSERRLMRNHQSPGSRSDIVALCVVPDDSFRLDSLISPSEFSENASE